MILKEYIHKHGIKDKRVVYEAAGHLQNRYDFEEWRMNLIMYAMLKDKIKYHKNLVDTYEQICASIANSEANKLG